MFRTLCNQLCITINKLTRSVMGQVARWSAAKAGLTILPPGFSMFNNELAKAHGVDRAAIFQKLKGWQDYNQRHDKRSHYRQGQWWTYGRPEYWHEKEFGWVSLSTVKRAFKELQEKGLLLIDQSGGQMWLCATSAGQVKLDSRESNLQLSLPILDSAGSKWPSSIRESSKDSSAKVKRQSAGRARAGVRKDAVADFNLPKPENKADFETHENRDSDVEGQDVLHELPGQLVTGWRDSGTPIDVFVSQHGIAAIRNAWEQASRFDDRIAGTRYLLGQAPTPSSAPPPSPAPVQAAAINDHCVDPDDDTEPDGSMNDTPDIDVPDVVEADPNAEAWGIAYSQLEIQLDRASFETWLRGASYLRAEDDVWVIGVANTYARDMLQHRLYREVRRVLGDVLGNRVELRFEVMGART